MAAAEDELRSHLDSGEKLLWVGRPAQGMVLTRPDWYLIPCSVVFLGVVVVWLGFAVDSFWQGSTKTPGALAVVVLALAVVLSLPFFAVGLYLLIGRFFEDRLYRSRLIYGVTDRRAIIVSGVRRRSVQSIYLSSLSALKLEERRDGSGTIYFGDQPTYWYSGSSTIYFDAFDLAVVYAPWFSRQTCVGTQLFRIADAKKVYAILHEAMQRQKK